MSLEELQERININLDKVNNAKSISSKRRYFVYLCGLVEVYNELTHENIQVAKYDSNNIMKNTLSENFFKELFYNGKLIFERSFNIVDAYKKTNWTTLDYLTFNTYSEKFLSELFEDFVSSLGVKYELIFKNMLKKNQLFLSKNDIAGATIFDYEKRTSYMFLPINKNNLYFFSILAHELGHVFEYERTKCSRKCEFVNNFNITTEVFALFIEILFCDYLKRINFNELEIKKLENKYYGDFLTYTTQIKFALSCPYLYVNKNGELISESMDEVNKYLKYLENEDNYKYYIQNINLTDSIYYMYGYFIADIYREYYNLNKNFIREIENHFFDYEAYASEEILKKLPYVKSLTNFDILMKHLKN